MSRPLTADPMRHANTNALPLGEGDDPLLLAMRDRVVVRQDRLVELGFDLCHLRSDNLSAASSVYDREETFRYVT